MDGSILESSIFEVGAKLSEDEYQDEVISYVQGILNKNFPESKNRRTVRKYPGRINFCCPLCGDSASDANKKRGNIITRGKYAGFYKCHNCGAMMGVVKFLKKCGIEKIDTKLVSYVNNEKLLRNPRVSDPVISTADMIFYMDEIDEVCVPRETIKNALRLKECDGSDGDNKGAVYLHSRLQFDHKRFMYDDRMDQLYVLNLSPSGKIFGFQRRELNKERATRCGKYKTYSLSKIYSDVLRIELPEDILGVVEEYNELSMVFNVLMVDYNRPVFVTEGPMDAIMLGNSIALCGGSKHLDIGVDDLYYLYDSDKDGVKYAVNALNEGKKVFMWRKYIEDNGIEKRSKWDINDLFLYFSEKRQNIPNFMNYFTNDPLAAFDL